MLTNGAGVWVGIVVAAGARNVDGVKVSIGKTVIEGAMAVGDIVAVIGVRDGKSDGMEVFVTVGTLVGTAPDGGIVAMIGV